MTTGNIYFLLPIFRKAWPSFFRVLNRMSITKQYPNICFVRKKKKYCSLMTTLSSLRNQERQAQANPANTDANGAINRVSILSGSCYVKNSAFI